MKMIIAIALSLPLLVSCGKGKNGDNGIAGVDGKPGTSYIPEPTPEEPEIDADQLDIDNLVAFKNEFRAVNGQNPLVKGLMCQLFTFTGGDRIQASIGGHNTLQTLKSVGHFEYSGAFNQPESPIGDGMNVLPEPFRTMYKNLYLIRCQGQLVVQESAYYKFDLNSDDASLLYIGGSLLIDNDNNHAPTLVSRVKLLERGIYSFRLDYAQSGGGSQALQLKVNDQSIDSKYYYR